MYLSTVSSLGSEHKEQRRIWWRSCLGGEKRLTVYGWWGRYLVILVSVVMKKILWRRQVQGGRVILACVPAG